MEMNLISQKIKKRKTMTTSIDEELHYRFKLMCIERKMKMNDALESFIQEYIKSNEEGERSGIPNK